MTFNGQIYQMNNNKKMALVCLRILERLVTFSIYFKKKKNPYKFYNTIKLYIYIFYI